MPQTLCVEGPDRDQLIDGIRATYGEFTLITSVDTVRRGGVLGFFARELFRVSFEPMTATPMTMPAVPAVPTVPTMPAVPTMPTMPTMPATPVAGPPPPAPIPPVATGAPGRGRHRAFEADTADDVDPGLAALLQLADTADGPPPGGDAFSAVLASFSAQPAPTAKPAPPASAAQPIPTVQPAPPPSAPPPIAPPRPLSRPGVDVRNRVEMLSGLRAVGIPLADNPKSDEISLYRAIEQIVDELPPAPALPARAGEIVVVVGAPDQVGAAATVMATRLHLAPQAIWRTGPVAGHERVIAGPMDALAQVPRLREATTPSLIVIEIDAASSEQRFGWAPQLVAALQPDAVWAAVDAGRKVEDLRAELASLGPIDALIVGGAARTASPATVWDLDLPIAVVDGRPATAGTWAGLLFDALRGGG